MNFANVYYLFSRKLFNYNENLFKRVVGINFLEHGNMIYIVHKILIYICTIVIYRILIGHNTTIRAILF